MYKYTDLIKVKHNINFIIYLFYFFLKKVYVYMNKPTKRENSIRKIPYYQLHQLNHINYSKHVV